MAVRVAHWLRRHALVAYFVGAYLISWIGVLPLVLAAQGWFPVAVSPHLHGLGALGPVLAAFVVTAIFCGRGGVAALVSRLFRWRVGVFWWLVAVLSPVLLFAVAGLMLHLLGQPWWNVEALQHAFADPEWVLGLLIASLAYGFGEEPGWRGFALPRLQATHSAFAATLMLSVFWACWHLPFFFYRFDFEGVVTIVGFLISMLAGALWLTFLYNSTGGSVLMVALWHTIWNVMNVVGSVLSDALVAVMSMLMVVIGIAALVVGGPRRLSVSDKHIVRSEQPVQRSAGHLMPK